MKWVVMYSEYSNAKYIQPAGFLLTMMDDMDMLLGRHFFIRIEKSQLIDFHNLID